MFSWTSALPGPDQSSGLAGVLLAHKFYLHAVSRLPGYCYGPHSTYSQETHGTIVPLFNGQSNTDSIVCKARQAASLHGTSPAPGLIRTESF